MPQTCTICAHNQTKEIEQEIVAGQAHTQIADKYGVNNQSVRYHSIHHLPEKLVHAVKKKKQNHAEDMLSGIKDLLDRTKNILDTAEDKNQNHLALSAIKEARSTYELLSKIAVKLEDYRRADEKKKTKAINNEASKGLEALSDQELKAFIQLTAKIKSQDEDYILDQEARVFVDSVNRMNAYSKNNNKNNNKDSGPDSRQTAPTQVKNTQKKQSNTEPDTDDDLMLDDLDGLDLDDLSDSRNNVIPSEETDPPWRK